MPAVEMADTIPLGSVFIVQWEDGTYDWIQVTACNYSDTWRANQGINQITSRLTRVPTIS